jgi:hypothetical protein
MRYGLNILFAVACSICLGYSAAAYANRHQWPDFLGAIINLAAVIVLVHVLCQTNPNEDRKP